MMKIIQKLAASMAMLVALSNAAYAEYNFVILDILKIQEGHTVEDANAYFAKVEPFFKRYGMRRTDAVLPVMSIPRGNVDAQVVNLWEVKNPQAAFEGVFSDKDYLKHEAERDAIFDLKNSTVIVTQRQQ